MTQPLSTFKRTFDEAFAAFVALLETLESEIRISLMLAYTLAYLAHKGQFRITDRRSDIPKQDYIIHPIRVMLILAVEIGSRDQALLAAALLHDVIEDGKGRITWANITGQLGNTTAEYVEYVTKSSDKLTPEQEHAYLVRIAGACEQVRLLKLADRIDNLRDAKTRKRLTPSDVAFIRRQLLETQKYFLPMAQATNAYTHAELLRLCDELAARTA